MSTKERHTLNLAWECLASVCSREGVPITAGQLAKEMGVTRPTAVSRIKAMKKNKAITELKTKKGDVTQRRYCPLGFVVRIEDDDASNN